MFGAALPAVLFATAAAEMKRIDHQMTEILLNAKGDRIATHLPPNIRNELVRAAELSDPVARVVEIDRACNWARLIRPDLFQFVQVDE